MEVQKQDIEHLRNALQTVPKEKGAKIKMQVRLDMGDGLRFKNINTILSAEQIERLLSDVEFDTIIDEYGINPDNVEELEVLSIEIDFV